jgi:hypothetical protein
MVMSDIRYKTHRNFVYYKDIKNQQVLDLKDHYRLQQPIQL